MDYPDGFEIPAFPAGKRIAVSRVMGIGIMSVFLLIAILASLIIWAARSRTINPIIISVNNTTGVWEIIDNSHSKMNYSVNRTLQESVVGNFLQNWFWLSDNPDANALVWQACEREAFCIQPDKLMYGDKTCALFCGISDGLFSKFKNDVIADYQLRANDNEFWIVDSGRFQIMPAGQITELGGVWRVQATIISSLSGKFNILGYARVSRNMQLYPKTMGFFIDDFNAYRIK